LFLADVLRAGLPGYAASHRLPQHHWKILNAIQVCRTPLLGAHLYQCAHACVPTWPCTGAATGIVPPARASTACIGSGLRPIPYFHLVFTLPHALNPLIQQNQETLYDLLFASASQTLLTFGRNNLGAVLGITAVLHTWSQTLLDHYHLHCIVSGGGPSRDGKVWNASRSDYLFHVSALSKVFRAKFCQGLQQLYAENQLLFHGQLQPLAANRKFQELVRQATRTSWVVYSKRPFAGPQQVLAYLSRYTHRVGISNRRLLKLNRAANTISFDYKDYADGARHKEMVLTLSEFIRRLRLHFLPPKFVKIRHYGLLANRGRRQRLERARALLKVPTLEASDHTDASTARSLPRCPHCGWAALFLVRVLKPSRLKALPPRTDTS